MEVVEDLNQIPEGFKMTELGPLPEDWGVVRLGDVAEISAGGSAPQGKEFFGGVNPFIRVQHVDNESYTIIGCDFITDEAIKKYGLKKYKKGTVIFPKSGASIYLEKRAMLPFDCYIVNHLCAVSSKSQKLLQNFLFYALIKTKFAEKKGDGYPTLNLSEIRQFYIPLPPIDEQKAIAYVLSSVQTVIEKTEAVIKATKELKKSLMKHLFTYGPVPLDEIDKVKLKDTEIGPILEDWEVVRLGEVADYYLGRTPPRKEKESWDNGVFPWVSISDMQDYGKITSTKEKVSKYALEKYFKNRVSKRGTLLMSFKLTVGRTAILEIDAVHNEAIISIFPSNRVDKIFLFYLLPNIDFSVYMDRAVKGNTLNKEKIDKTLIPLPPLPIQQKIAEILSAVDQKIQAEENKKKALNELFKSLLHNLMTGKIRVKDLRVEDG